MAYSSSSIETLRFPAAIRNNCSMYLGSTDEHGRWLIARELLDNGLDEHLAGRNKGVIFVECKDDSYWVIDFGGGIPQGFKSFDVNVNGKIIKNKMPTMQAIFSELHTSGKFRSEAYKLSIGTHGIGAKGTNATSDFFDVYTKFEGQWYSIKFEKGILTQPVKEIKTPKGPTGKPLKRGTAIHFKPDATIFNGKSNIDLKFAHQWAEITSYLNPGFTVMILDKNGKSKKYLSQDGPVEYVDKILSDLKANAEQSKFVFHNDLCDAVIAFSNAEGLNVRGYTNGLFNSQGGKHVDSVCTISPYDVKEGLVGIVNMKLHKAEFSSQDKSRLTDLRAGKDFEELMTKEFETFFRKNKSLAMRLCEKASKLSQLRSQFKASKKVVQALNAVKRKGMPAKYSPYDSRTKIEDRELLIVEGESASGGLREKRKPWQALCPLKGKISNSFKNGQKTLESEEVLMILGALGFDPKADDPLKKLQIEKVICLADPDPDGPLVGNTLIPTNKGLMPIWEVANAYRKGIDYTDLNRLQVLAYDEKRREPVYADLTWAGVTCRTTIKYTVSFLATNIQTASIGEEPYEIECTASHKWAVREDDGVNIRYVRTDELQLGDNVVSYILFANKKGFPSSSPNGI